MRPSLRSPRQADEVGASAVEYGLLVALIAGIIVVAVATLGTTAFGLYDESCGDIASTIDGSTC